LLLVVTGIVILTSCGGPGTDAVLKARAIRAQERLGIRPALATCIANASSVELSRDEMRTLVTNPAALPPGLAERVTKLAADCAIEVAPTPTTLPVTATSPTSTATTLR
jgi:hypothetical protein